MSVVELSDAGFGSDVLETAGPVLVHFCATWAGPCRQMRVTLEDLAGQYEGRLILAELDIDKNPETGPKYQVTAVPTLHLFKNAKVVDTRIGPHSKAQVAQFLDASL